MAEAARPLALAISHDTLLTPTPARARGGAAAARSARRPLSSASSSAALARRFGVDRLLHVAAGDDRVGDARREQPDRAQRIVVARE